MRSPASSTLKGCRNTAVVQPIDQILTKLGVEFVRGGHKHSRPGWLQIKWCPFCNSDRFHLGWNLAHHYTYCWRCRYHHAVATLRALGARNAKDLFKELKKDHVDEPIEKKERLGLKEPPFLGPLLPAHEDYLEQRGFDVDEIEAVWKIKGLGIAPRLRWRIYIPIFEAGRQVSWTTRAIGDKVEQRYVSASADEESVNHKEVVYGLDYCTQSVVVVEGPTDAWAVGPGAGALFGTAFSTAQVRKLARIPYRFVCFDSSTDAQRNALQLVHQLSCLPGVTHNVILDAKDPGSAPPREIEALRRAAKLI